MTGESSSPAPQKRSFSASTCFGCGGLLLLVVGGFAAASWGASRSLERRMVLLGVELRDARAAQPPERAPLFHLGREAQDGDAADDYAALAWVLGPPPSMTTIPPGADATGLRRDHPNVSGTPYLLVWPEGTTLEDMLDARQPLTPEMVETLALYGPLTRHVRSGVRRARCDWKVDLTKGFLVDRVNLEVLQAVAEYMACEAASQPTLAASRTGLEVVAFGRDVARHDTLVGAALGMWIQGVGVRAIARALDQGGATKEELAELLAALDALPPLDFERALVCERLSTQVGIACLSAHPLAPRTPARPAPGQPTGLPIVSRIGPLFFEREMAGYADAMRDVGEALKRPTGERRAAHEAARARYQRHLFASFAVPNLAVMHHTERAAVAVDLCRLLLAAHLYRAETGRTPARDVHLARRLGGQLPRDPFSGAPVRWAVKDGRLRAWSVGPNLTDEGGTPGTGNDEGDVVVSTKLP
jgi:hypothetical protein